MNTVYPSGVNNISINYSIVNDQVIWANFWNDMGRVAYSKSTDGGNTWNAVPTVFQYNDSNFRVTDFFAVSENVAFLAASYQNNIGRGRLYKTVNGGTTWNAVKDFSTLLSYVHFWDANVGIAVCYPDNSTTGSKKIEIFKTTDGGVTWVAKGGGLLTDSRPNQIPRYIKDDLGNSFWFGSSDGEMIKTNDQGTTWSVTQSPYDSSHYEFGTKSLGHFAMIDTNTAYFTDFNTGKLYKTTDGFVTEQYVSDPGFGRQTYLEKIPNTDILIAVSGSFNPGTSRGSKYSTDGGLTWVLINNIGRMFVKSKGIDMTFAFGWDGLGGDSDYWRIVKLNGRPIDPQNPQNPQNPGSPGSPGTPGSPQIGSGSESDIFGIYPIPTGDFLNIKSKVLLDSFLIWDFSGRLIWQGKSDNNKINVSWLSKGVYQVSVLHQGIYHYRKFIKE
ncbi:T9SS type A sorting domain-containing protein [Chryseobacterium luquanense]|uniref:T9SS type A sorting domain-containing protein n=1 Tax=Chryseobacterium luquanense TaxID=2983766 RepID=A0ABT3Y1L3_9FLAO|nr:T9SS type A sorting domain-containing protein [Chryseobacterium luquanense]MCX8532032.1 T9SS type A sorting domain-containing protein [Chryseobacterium luquanense]